MTAIASDPILREATRASLPELNALVAPAGWEAVKALIGTLLLPVFDPGERTRTPAWWSIYYDALAELPAHALEAGMREYPSVALDGFFPKPKALRDLALKHARDAFTAVGRARAVVALPRPTHHEPADRTVVERVKADLAKRMRRSPPPKPFTPPPTPTPTDDTGLSAAMRARVEAAPCAS